MTGKYTLETIEEQIKGLPLIDSAAFEVIGLLNDANADFDQIVEKLSPDIAARFLNMANTAYYGRTVRSINYAVSLLGFSRMRQILITSFLIDHFTKNLDFKQFNFEKFQQQAHFNAAIAQALGEMLGYPKTEELFTVAMLQNIGKLVIAVYFKEEYREINAMKKEDGVLANDAEKKILGVSHAEIGAVVLQRFSLPEDMCDAVRFHDSKDRVVPIDANYSLEFITRMSALIVAGFKLPDQKELAQIVERLQGAIAEGREIYKNESKGRAGRKEMQKGYIAALRQTSGMVIELLKEQIVPRVKNASAA